MSVCGSSAESERRKEDEPDIDDLYYEGGIEELLEHTSQYNPHQMPILKCIDETTESVMMIDEIEADVNEGTIHMRNSKRSNSNNKEAPTFVPDQQPQKQPSRLANELLSNTGSCHHDVIRDAAIYAAGGGIWGGGCYASEPSAIEIMLEKSSIIGSRGLGGDGGGGRNAQNMMMASQHKRHSSAGSGATTTTSSIPPDNWRAGNSAVDDRSVSVSSNNSKPETTEAVELTTTPAQQLAIPPSCLRSVTPSTYTGTNTTTDTCTMSSSLEDGGGGGSAEGRNNNNINSPGARTRRKLFRDRFMKNRGIASKQKAPMKTPSSSTATTPEVAVGGGNEEINGGNKKITKVRHKSPLRKFQQPPQSPPLYTDTTMQETTTFVKSPDQHGQRGSPDGGVDENKIKRDDDEEEEEEASIPRANNDTTDHRHATKSPMMLIRRPRGRSRSRKLKVEQQQQQPSASSEDNKRNRSRSRSRPRLLLPKLICGGKAVDAEYERSQMLILAQQQQQYQNQTQVMSNNNGPDSDDEDDDDDEDAIPHNNNNNRSTKNLLDDDDDADTGDIADRKRPTTPPTNHNNEHQQQKNYAVSQYQLTSPKSPSPQQVPPLLSSDNKNKPLASTVLSVPRNSSHISELSLPNFNRIESSVPAAATNNANDSNSKEGGDGGHGGQHPTKASATLEEVSKLLHQIELDIMNGKKVTRSELLHTLKSATETLDDRVPVILGEEEEEGSSGILASQQGDSAGGDKSFINKRMYASPVEESAFSPLTTKAVIGREESSSISGLATRSTATSQEIINGRALADDSGSESWSKDGGGGDDCEDERSDSDSLISETTDFTKWLQEIDEGDTVHATSKESLNYLLDLFNFQGRSSRRNYDEDDCDYEDYDDEHSGSNVGTPTASVLQGGKRALMTNAAALSAAFSPNSMKNANWGEMSPTSFEWWRAAMMPSLVLPSSSKSPLQQKMSSCSHPCHQSGKGNSSSRQDEGRRNSSADRPVSCEVHRIAPPSQPPTEDVLSLSSIESNQYDDAWAGFGNNDYSDQNQPNSSSGGSRRPDDISSRRMSGGSNGSAPKRRSKSLGSGGRRDLSSKRAQHYHYLVAGN